MANYNEEAVSKEIAKDPSIGGAEAKAIHSLLKGRERGPAATADCKHTDLSLVAKDFGAKQQNFVHCRCGLRWRIIALGNRLASHPVGGGVHLVARKPAR